MGGSEAHVALIASRVAGYRPYFEEAVLHYWRGGESNPWLSEQIVPVPMSRADLEALVAFLRALDGEGYADVAPRLFPR
jgi:hypothetical protein